MALVESFGLGMIDKGILDGIKLGNKVSCNDWKDEMIVVGVSNNYIVLNGYDSYAIIEKKKVDHSRNHYTKGSFRVGACDHVFMMYDTSKEDDVQKLLNELETGETNLSVRNSVDLKIVTVVRV